MGQIFLEGYYSKVLFQSLTLDFSNMVHCRDPNSFPGALKHLPEPGYIFSAPFSLMEALCCYGVKCVLTYITNSKHTFYPIATLGLHQGKRSQKRHFLVLAGVLKHQEKNQVSTVHHVGEIKCQTLKKNNIIPGKFYPYGVGSYNHV